MKKRHIVFQLNNDYCAVSIEEILEIVTLGSMVKTSTTELNVMYWNNASIPIVDPYAMLTLKDHKPTSKSRIVIVKKQGKDFGILFDAVLGIIEVDENLVQEPMLNEPRYVRGIYEDKVKIFTPEALLTKHLVQSFERVYQLELHHLEEGIKVHGQKAQGKDEIIDKIRLRSLNWLVRATKSRVDESFVQDVIEIHDLVSKL